VRVTAHTYWRGPRNSAETYRHETTAELLAEGGIALLELEVAADNLHKKKKK
jgi:hypothetical protein